MTGLDLLVGTFFDESQERTKAKVVILGPGPVTELFGGDAGARDRAATCASGAPRSG